MNDSQENIVLAWTLPEYTHTEKNNDWFWALGIIILCGSITSIIYANYFFAGLLILGGSLMGYFANKAPDLVSYKLTDKGLIMRNRLHPYEEIKSFWVQTPSAENGMESLLFIDSGRYFMPIITMPTHTEDREAIRERLLSKGIEEKEMKEHVAVAIMDFLGF